MCTAGHIISAASFLLMVSAFNFPQLLLSRAEELLHIWQDRSLLSYPCMISAFFKPE